MLYAVLFFGVSLIAAPFVSRQHIEDWHNNVSRPYTSYGTLRECVSKHGQNNCFDLAGRDISVTTLKIVEVDDASKPIYAAKTDVTPCKIYDTYLDELTGTVQKDDCRYLVRYEGKKPGDEIIERIEVINEPVLCTDKTYYPLYAETDTGYEAYCTKLLGYQKKEVELFVADQSLVEQKKIKESELLKKELAKKASLDAAKNHLKQVQGSVENLSQKQIADLMEQIIILLGD
jgi:hypothetical protein